MLHATAIVVTTGLLLTLVNAAALSLSNEGGLSRRDVLGGAAAATVGAPLFVPTSNPARAASGDSAAPIAIVGASGRTGALCVASVLRRGLPAKALTRSGAWPPPKIDFEAAVGYYGDVASDPLLTVEACDVKSGVDAISAHLSGCRAVIYAASASKRGGNSKEIDCDGVVTTGEACIKEKVGRYVVLSSGSTTRPRSLGFKFTELAVAGIMTNKRLGEVGVRDAFASSESSSYTVVRPGGLDEPRENIVQGPSALELTQGDVLAGFVSRADVAEVAVELALSSAPNVRNTALELYYRNNVVPVDRVYRKYLKEGVERLHGDTYEELFEGIKANCDYLTDA